MAAEIRRNRLGRFTLTRSAVTLSFFREDTTDIPAKNMKFGAMVIVALALRLAAVAFLYPERLSPNRDHWRFAGETGRIAQSIVAGKGFSSPLFGETGPTAWMTPIYPYMVAGTFKIFGIYTKPSAIILLSLNSLFSALTCVPIFFIARRNFGYRVARAAGWTWAFFPYAIYFSADFIWATTLTTFLLSLIFLCALHLEDSTRPIVWIGFGLLCGISALTDPIVLSVVPLLGAWACSRHYQCVRKWALAAAGAALAFLVVVMPWFVRNYRVFHVAIPFRDNFGLELYLGNNGDTWHFAPSGHHPSDSASEMSEYAQLGESAFMARKRRQAFEYISGHPGTFIFLSLRRMIYMWTSFWSFSSRYLQEENLDPPNIVLCTTMTVLALLGLRRAYRERSSLVMPYAIVLVFFPLVYYITHPEDYYRRPIDPILLVPAVYAVVSRVRRSKGLPLEDEKPLSVTAAS
ncbi:MAG TPA: glycosyltransferase family 39 protein [Candidatus Limnocylindria bacterium]|nr:glycosyltransferase family 39 protein [Candidatus Limnocylindria bacterium]